MKLLILLIPFTLLLTSCNNNSISQEDEKVNIEFLSWSFVAEFNELNLSNQELTQVPNFEQYLTWTYIDNVWSIDLSNNMIKNIDGELFKYFPNLKELNLSYNQIEDITLEHNFIQDLKLHKNILKEVNIEWLSKLNSVNLWYNELLSWSDILLPKSIKTLELQHNKLADLNWLGNLENLESLKVEFNELEDMDLKELANLDMLKFISVWRNKISKKLEEKIKQMNMEETEK